MKPLAIDLFCGLFGFGEVAAQEGYDVVGFDLEDMAGQFGMKRAAGCQLVIQDVLTLHGSQFKDAALIWASPPCQFFSYTAMPWSRAKALAAEVRADPARLEKELALFNACFRIQREASAAAGRHVPMVVENVRGAIPWVGRSRAKWGSFYLWGDVPAILPPCDSGIKVSGDWFASYAEMKAAGTISPTRMTGKNTLARKKAQAVVAKIPKTLSRHIARVFYP